MNTVKHLRGVSCASAGRKTVDKDNGPTLPDLKTSQTVSSRGDNVPRFLTEGRHHRVVQTETLTLPCKVVNIGNLIRAWKRGIAVLTAGSVKLSPDERLSLVHGYDLEIRDVRPEDEGDYVCQIASLTPMEITHTVEILVPPQIVEVSGSGLVEVKKGTPVSLECRGKGNPIPFYQWSRRVGQSRNNFCFSGQTTPSFDEEQELCLSGLLPSKCNVSIDCARAAIFFFRIRTEKATNIAIQEHKLYYMYQTNTTWPGLKPVNGSTYAMGPATRHMAGKYQCIASNGVGHPATREVDLKILYQPEVVIDDDWVHTGIGTQAILTCTVYAEPAPEVRWYRGNTLRLEVTDDHKTEKRGNRYRLIIQRVQLQDLDDYECSASNGFGKDRGGLVLSGKPRQPVFRSSTVSKWRDGYNITWSVFSYSTIEEHQLFYRRKQFEGRLDTNVQHERWGVSKNLTYYNVREWADVSIAVQPDYKRTDITQEMSYMILGLEANTQYEAKVQARNTFGWSKMSEIFSFSTSAEGGYSWETPEVYHPHDNEIRDMGVTALGKAPRTPALVTVLLASALASTLAFHSLARP